MSRQPKKPRKPHSQTKSDTLAVVLGHHQAGRVAEADAGYQRLVNAQPNDPDAWHLWGVLAAQQGQYEQAVERIQQALELKPHEPVFLGNLGNAFLQQGQFGQAIDCYLEALQRQPDDVDLRKRLEAVCERQLDLGIEHQKADRLADAETCYQDVLLGQPKRADAWHLLGTIALEREQFETARERIGRAIELAPDVANYHNSLGGVYQKQRRDAEAIACYHKALHMQPDLVNAHLNLGQVYQVKRRVAEAEASYRRALELRPDYPEAYYNLGCLLKEVGRTTEAEAAYGTALECKPRYLDAHFALGELLYRKSRYLEALICFESVLAVQAEYPFVHGAIRKCRAKICEWTDDPPRSLQHVLDRVRQGNPCITPFVFLNVSDDPCEQRRCAETWVRYRHWHLTTRAAQSSSRSHAKIRLAYISPDFREHPVAYLIADLIERHDRARFEVFGLSIGPDANDPWRQRLAKGFDQFLDVRAESDEAVVQRMRELEIDIAVDLAGYTTSSRPGIFAGRAAPIQVNYLGYPGTMGAEFMDYILADRCVIPEDRQACYTEQVVYLPDTFQCASRREIADHTPSRRELGLPEAGFVFCCFNNTYKIHPQMFDIWMRLLAQVEGSVLWLAKSNESVERNLRREAGARGVSPDRLIFASRVPLLAQHLARYRQADLFLDTLPYNAHTTASDALWAGLPVLTCRGQAFAGRVAGSLLGAIGLPELVTDNLAEYEALALRLANRPDELAALKQKLAVNRTTQPLFDVNRFRRHIEAAYQRMWVIWQRGDLPAAFTVEAIETGDEADRVAMFEPMPEDAQPSSSHVRLIEIEGGIKVCAKDSLESMTSYILLEQGDWFESEMAFIRRLIIPGMQILDIGANHGVYTLTMAKLLYGQGQVTAYEPASSVVTLLQKGVEANALTTVTIIKAGLSDHDGQATLFLEANSELNSLNQGRSDQQRETIQLHCLDDEMARHGWRDISFVKLDAEGEEPKILAGGQRFFSTHSPLVMFELKHGRQINLPLIQLFRDRGYQTFRYVPGVGCLVPFDVSETVDGYQLNLFACKADRASQLAERGLLVREIVDKPPLPRPQYWLEGMSKLAYARPFVGQWQQQAKSPTRDSDVYLEGLNLFFQSKAIDIPASARFTSLQRAFVCLQQAVKANASFSRLCSSVRVAAELGSRAISVKGLQELVAVLAAGKPLTIDDPFLPVAEPYDDVPLDKTTLADWLVVSILETYEKQRVFSSYFSPQRSVDLLRQVVQKPFHSEWAERRLELAKTMLERKQAGLPNAGPGASKQVASSEMFPISEIFAVQALSIVDIGAMELGRHEDRLVRLSKQGIATILGFEPLAEECAKLNAKADGSRQYLPYAIADGSKRTLYITNTGMTSSLLPPNQELLSLFMNLAELIQVVRTAEIDTRRLDDIPDITEAGCDLLKLDVQGLEWEILCNATNVLSTCLVVQTEVEFVPLYHNQPLFAEVDQVLRNNGFVFHKFLGLAGRPFKPLSKGGNPNVPISQVLWSDAVYVRDFTQLEGLSKEQLLKLATLLHEVYGSVDLCHRVLAAYDAKTGRALAGRYLDRLVRGSS